METKVYNCKNPTENPLPDWLRQQFSGSAEAAEPLSANPVEAFKQNPDAFFPDFVSKS
ncbi:MULTISPECIES: hypothetical protein [Caproicibacterium]|uniref:Uncharacterized protein n=1 Tax=Caproicibacterium argilliputei TaxID=3030016 RepID=A0AA97D9A4_9FIRM|nr:hypothetical protein [Caproicibacterium argilliputei]WOC32614.1 hypothetical protein PXC00_01715 [Caproicibacterium argilliputei]